MEYLSFKLAKDLMSAIGDGEAALTSGEFQERIDQLDRALTELPNEAPGKRSNVVVFNMVGGVPRSSIRVTVSRFDQREEAMNVRWSLTVESHRCEYLC